jgi:hypothetical protein
MQRQSMFHVRLKIREQMPRNICCLYVSAWRRNLYFCSELDAAVLKLGLVIDLLQVCTVQENMLGNLLEKPLGEGSNHRWNDNTRAIQ